MSLFSRIRSDKHVPLKNFGGHGAFFRTKREAATHIPNGHTCSDPRVSAHERETATSLIAIRGKIVILLVMVSSRGRCHASTGVAPLPRCCHPCRPYSKYSRATIVPTPSTFADKLFMDVMPSPSSTQRGCRMDCAKKSWTHASSRNRTLYTTRWNDPCMKRIVDMLPLQVRVHGCMCAPFFHFSMFHFSQFFPSFSFFNFSIFSSELSPCGCSPSFTGRKRHLKLVDFQEELGDACGFEPAICAIYLLMFNLGV